MSILGGIGKFLSGVQGANLQNPVSTQQAQDAYNTSQNALNQQQAFVNALAAQGGIQNQSNVFNQQQDLANQLQAAAMGTAGPSAAQTQLSQATGQNVANQAALMAGQRGANANIGLLARQAAMQGANAQQQSTGQAATLRANEQLAARQQLQNQQSMMGGLATQQVNQQAQGTGNLNQFAQNEQGMLLNQINAQNNAQLANTGMINQGTQAGIQTGLKMASGLGQAAGIGMAEGGEVPSISGPKSNLGKHFHGLRMANGGQVPVMLSPGEKYLSPEEAEQVAKGKKSPTKAGKTVPGKAKVKGDSLKNDVVPTKLEEGGVVIPRSVMNSKDPAKEASKFVASVLAKGRHK